MRPPARPTTRPVRLVAALLAATALAAACGDSSEVASPPPPPPPAQIAVSFISPAAGDNVFDLGAAVPLRIGVSTSGAAAANGTPVTLTLSPAASAGLTPPVPTTSGGVAAAELQGRSIGPLSLRASASSTTATASDERTLYIRPAPEKLGVLVPAYFSAGATSPWADLLSGANTSHPDVPMAAIVKPATGVDAKGLVTAPDTDLAADIASFRALGTHRALAYVATGAGSGARSVADVKAVIDSYLTHYPMLDGFFLDEMATGSDRLAFYRELYVYIKGRAPALVVVGNPAAFPAAGYADPLAGAADVLVTYEGNAAGYQGLDPQPASTWVYAKPNNAQAMLVHSAASCTAMQQAVGSANRPRANTGWVFASDQPVGAPWAALPSYWIKLLATVDALNQKRSLPAC
jgi:hypothetical protein